MDSEWLTILLYDKFYNIIYSSRDRLFRDAQPLRLWNSAILQICSFWSSALHRFLSHVTSSPALLVKLLCCPSITVAPLAVAATIMAVTAEALHVTM